MNDLIEIWGWVSEVLFLFIGILVAIIGRFITDTATRVDSAKFENHTDDALVQDGEIRKPSQGNLEIEVTPIKSNLLKKYLFKFLVVLLRFLANTTDDQHTERKSQVGHDRKMS